MEKKFLVFSCLVLLISIVYFIYTSYRLHIVNENQQDVTPELEAPFIASWVADGAFQYVTPEESIPELIEGEIEEFESVSEGMKLEGAELTAKVISDIGSLDEMEAKTSQEQNSQELETLFTDLKQLYDQREIIYRETTPFSTKLRKLKYRQIEIGLYDLVGASGEETKRLHDEFHRSQGEMQELRTTIAILDEQRLQIEKEVEEIMSEYGMTVAGFYDRYGQKYESWKSGQ